ncbi:MAG: IclR family transcriptional regulator C-terminal domain-containing protein [Polaromonas sp.]|nr:IclR family transcriptional regulator C-terminal domain-containing protein [Polaromonas sp.]
MSNNDSDVSSDSAAANGSSTPDGSLDKMLSILNLFTEENSSITQEDIVASIGCSRATAYRYLKSLSTAGLIGPVHGGAYVVGSRVIELDRLLRLRDPILLAARGVMASLARKQKVNVMLCAYYGDKVMCADTEWPDTSYKSSYERGKPMPMFLGATAKSILAHLTPYQQRNLMLWHPAEIRAAGLGKDWDEFRANMRRIRKEGVVVSHGEIDNGLIGLGAPIFSAEQKVLGSLVAIVPSEGWATAKPKLEKLRAAVQVAADELTHKLSEGHLDAPPARASRPRRMES